MPNEALGEGRCKSAANQSLIASLFNLPTKFFCDFKQFKAFQALNHVEALNFY
jgi:hypothetical protein